MEDMFRRTISTHRHPPPQLLQAGLRRRRPGARRRRLIPQQTEVIRANVMSYSPCLPRGLRGTHRRLRLRRRRRPCGRHRQRMFKNGVGCATDTPVKKVRAASHRARPARAGPRCARPAPPAGRHSGYGVIEATVLEDGLYLPHCLPLGRHKGYKVIRPSCLRTVCVCRMDCGGPGGALACHSADTSPSRPTASPALRLARIRGV